LIDWKGKVKNKRKYWKNKKANRIKEGSDDIPSFLLVRLILTYIANKLP
jgi:hypothetical protein